MATKGSFAIVGVGASAGGVQALEQMFRALRSNAGMAFVVVTHLPRDRGSNLREILARFTDMPVVTPDPGMAIEPDHVYVCPPTAIVTVKDRRMVLSPRASEAQLKPIDVFLSSLAEDIGADAIGILLSGSGSDGTLGMKAIKEQGGFTIAQGSDGSAPAYADMPDTAIAAGVVDEVLAVEHIADRLAFLALHDIRNGGDGDPRSEIPPAASEADIRAVYQLLREQVGHDFSGYKHKTFERRLHRRMQVLRLAELSRYVERLRRDPDEVSLLFRDLLIGVTNFFRDADAFEALEQTVMPHIFAGRTAADAVRIWVPGCATGEEVYSIAILAREQLDKMKAPPRVMIFATDIDEAALTVARAGRYPAPLMKDVTPARLQRFFVQDDVSYMVKSDIREMCIFSVHNVLRNPPFSRIDLVSCRNLLIYLGAAFQAQVIPVFHFSLRPRGFLFLGTSENVSQNVELFAPVDKKNRIFQCREHAVTPLDIPSFSASGGRVAPPDGAPRRDPLGLSTNLRHAVETRVLDRFAPAHVVVNRDGEILHYSSRTGKYLEPSTGQPTRQLAAMARKPLRLDLIAAFREAVDTRRAVVRESLSVQTDDRVQSFDLVIEPLADKAGDPLYLILFRDIGQPAASDPPAPGEGDVRVERLDQELGETRQRLQSLVEEYETAVEELKSSNEELQSVNEELQSSNEELETSKEELQSLNEELHTVNAELNSKIDELDSANSDLRNIFDSTRIATVFLDRDLVIRSFTPAVSEIFNLISTDRGRPLTDIVSHLALDDLRRDIRTVLEGGTTIERQVRRVDGRASYLMRVLPYRSQHGITEGVLVTFVDVTRLVEAEAQQLVLIEELGHRVHDMLTVVNAIAQQTLRASASPEAFTEAFSGRVAAISTAYRLVLRQGRLNVSLRDVLREQMQPYGGGGEDGGLSDRVRLAGPEVALLSGAVISFGLIAHELVTNAVKYGALSSPDGQIDISWRLDGEGERLLVLSWRESRGPPVKKPDATGFGIKLIEREVSDTMGGNVTLTYRPAGLSAVLSIPLDRISDAR